MHIIVKYDKTPNHVRASTSAFDGTRRRRLVLDSYEQLISDECYYGDLVVENGQPLRILHAEGYVDVSGMPVFNYHLKDHLGNVRAVISSSYGTGAFTQTQASDYYPFGMAHTVEISSIKNGKAMEAVRVDPRETDESKTFTRSNPYLYNGKEEQPMPGKWLDYGARFYDAQLGRWHSVDPMADQRSWVSSFSYCQNDPINRIDPDGMYDDWVEDPNHPEKGTYFDPNIKSIGEAEDAGLIWHGHTTLLLDKDGNTKYGDQYGKTWDMAPLMEVVVLAKMTDHQRIMSNPVVQAIHQGQEDFLNHPVTKATVNTLLFVATGGIEGVTALGGTAVRSIGNIKVSIYRVFGGEARAIGNYWSPINPKLYGSQYRNLAGLPNSNTGAFTLKATTPLRNINPSTIKPAAPLDGNFGRLVPELKVFDKGSVVVKDFWVNF